MNGRRQILVNELRYLFWPWAACVLLPMPLLLLGRSPLGRGYALMCFFVGCMVVVARSFWRDVNCRNPLALDAETARRVWRMRILLLEAMLLLACLVFTIVCILFNNPYNYGTPQGLIDEGIWWRAFVFEKPRDFAAPLLAIMSVGASLSIVPYLVLVTRKPFAAIVFAAALVGSMKFLGAILVVSIYGWDADEQGRLGMPWNDPDLLVWLFWVFSAILSLCCYVLGRRRFLLQMTASECSPAPLTAVVLSSQLSAET